MDAKAVAANVGLGRIFRSPQDQTAAGERELWINLGMGTKDTLAFPLYLPELAHVCDQEQYGALINGLRAYFQTHPVPVELEFHQKAASACCALSCGVLACPLIVLALKVRRARVALDSVLAARTKGWHGSVRIEYTEVCHDIPGGPTLDDVPSDQFDIPLSRQVTRTQSQIIWPPPGYSIVVSMPFRNLPHWPPIPTTVITAREELSHETLAKLGYTMVDHMSPKVGNQHATEVNWTKVATISGSKSPVMDGVDAKEEAVMEISTCDSQVDDLFDNQIYCSPRRGERDGDDIIGQTVPKLEDFLAGSAISVSTSRQNSSRQNSISL